MQVWTSNGTWSRPSGVGSIKVGLLVLVAVAVDIVNLAVLVVALKESLM